MKKTILLSTVVASALYGNMKVEWSQEFRAFENNSSVKAIAISENGILVGGSINGDSLAIDNETPPETPNQQAFLLKTDFEGNQTWFKSFGVNMLPDEVVDIFPVDNNASLVVGSTFGNAGEIDIFISRFENNGSQSWIRNFGTNGRDYPVDSAIDNMGNIYISGVTDGNFSDMNGSFTYIDSNIYNSNYSPFLIKVDQNGNLMANKDYGYENFWFNENEKRIAIKINELNGTDIFTVRKNENSGMLFIEILDENLTLKADFNTSIGENLGDFDFKSDENGSSTLFVATQQNLYKIEVDEVNSTDYNFFENGSASITDEYSSNPVAAIFDQKTDSIYLTGSHYRSMEGNLVYISKIDTNSMNRTALSYFSKSTNGGSDWGSSSNAIQISHDGSLLIGGLLDNRTFGEDNVSGSGLFFAKIRDAYAIIDLQEGWNLKSGNLDKNSLPNDIIVVYSYSERNPYGCEAYNSEWDCAKTWRSFSPDNKLNSALRDYAGLEEISDINNSNGLWIYSDKNLSINGGYNDENISTHNYPNGWSLNGIGVDKNLSADMFCRDTNSSIKSIWRLNEFADWEINTPDSTFMPTLQRFDIIKQNEGFWINCIENNISN